MSTLQFANRAKNITNRSRKNEDENSRLIRTLREEISRLQDNLVKEVGSEGVTSSVSSKEVTNLEDMISDLQVAKQQTWEEKERLSRMYEEERKKNLANKVRQATFVFSTLIVKELLCTLSNHPPCMHKHKTLMSVLMCMHTYTLYMHDCVYRVFLIWLWTR